MNLSSEIKISLIYLKFIVLNSSCFFCINYSGSKILKSKHIFLFLFCSIFLVNQKIYSQSILNLPVTNENFPKFDEYIRKYAPSDSAFNVMVLLANRQANSARNAVSREVLVTYISYFPNYTDVLKNRIINDEVLMQSQSATPDMYQIYEKYAVDSANTENGYLGIQRLCDNYINHLRIDSSVAFIKQFMRYPIKKITNPNILKKISYTDPKAEYVNLYPSYTKKLNQIIEILEAPFEGLKINNLGTNINTTGGEWDPNPTPDGRYLYLTVNGRGDGYGGHDVFVSTFKDGAWQKPVNVGPKVNGPNNETIDGISTDGNTILLSGDFEGTLGKFDIYLVTRDENGWGPLEHLPFPINTSYHDEGACISSDGKVLVFTSDRPGGTGIYVPNGQLYHGTNNGNMDIYVTFKTDSGWSKPLNIGKQINTPFAERSPFLHPDGKTLYFSSDGHPGLGKMDVFKTIRLDDTWTNWSEPVNLGKEINTILDDWGYKITVNGDSAFFASQWRTIGIGDWDVYSVQLPQKAKPDTVITIHGKVTDQDGKPISADIKWEDLTTGKNVGILKSDPRDGSYIIILPLGKNYGYFAEKKGYYSTSDNIDLRETSPKKGKLTVERDIKLISIADLTDKKVKVRINNIFFDFDDNKLKPESYPELDRLCKVITENPTIKIHVEGHTDNIGSSKYNLDLSKSRAEAVREYLIKKGIVKSRFTIMGFGDTIPVADNSNDEGRAKNRRVEVWFVK